MNLQDIMVTKVSQREKDKCFMESFVFRIQKSKQNKKKMISQKQRVGW